MMKSSLTPPTIDQTTLNHYIARGRRARSEALYDTVRTVFARKPGSRG